MENNLIKSIYNPRKPKIYKRLAAFILDFILFSILFVGILYLISLIMNIDKSFNTLNDLYYKYGLKILNNGSYEFCDSETSSCQIAMENIYKDATFKENFLLAQKFLIYAPIFSLFITYLILDFIIPLILKNGSSIGMKIFNLALLSKNGIKISSIQLFIRFLFGKFILNGILPIFGIMYILPFFIVSNDQLLTGLTFLSIYFIINIISVLVTKFRLLIPDVISGCLVIDANEQMFFDSVESLSQAKAKEIKEMTLNGPKKYKY